MGRLGVRYLILLGGQMSRLADFLYSLALAANVVSTLKRSFKIVLSPQQPTHLEGRQILLEFNSFIVGAKHATKIGVVCKAPWVDDLND